MQDNEESLGSYVKIISPDDDDNFGKIGFVGGTIQKTALCFSIYSFKGDQIVCLGDYASFELSMVGGKVSKEDLISRINSKTSSRVMIDEMQRLLKSLYKTN